MKFRLALETISTCNRRCPTCIRNSHPDRTEIRSWFKHHLLPMDIIEEALEQYAAMGKDDKSPGGVCLSHFSEPLMDYRIAEIARLAKSYDLFHPIYLNTNGDYLTEEIAESLDGVLDKIIISMYADKKKNRYEKLTSFFHKTEVILGEGPHIATHFSPKFDVAKLTEEVIDTPCTETRPRIIINHRQQYLLCCEDVVGNFTLGLFPMISLKDYWYGKKHTKLLMNLDKPGGRKKYEYCRICPRV